MAFYQSEKRRFVRVPAAMPVKYRYVSQVPSETCSVPREQFEGQTQNIGAGGILLLAPMPTDPELLTQLLMQKVVVGIEMTLPSSSSIQALCRVSWLEAIDEREGTLALGLRFIEITNTSRDELFRFVITSCCG